MSYISPSSFSNLFQSLRHQINMTTTTGWKETVIQKRKEQAGAIPKDWILKDLPSKDTLTVIDFPEQCGLLTSKDVEITNTGVDLLLEKLAAGAWSAVEVTTAFSKRAIIAHQLVRHVYICRFTKGVPDGIY